MKRRKLQVGDKVRIISRAYVESLPKKGEELKYCFTGVMKRFCGKIATIKDIKIDLYSLDIDDGYYSWSEGMFERRTLLLRNE